jgi:hypothetical protein
VIRAIRAIRATRRWLQRLRELLGIEQTTIDGVIDGAYLSDRRPLRNAADPTFQGDGWRWTAYLLLPDVLLWRRPDGSPLSLGELVLTREQRLSCWLEWRITQDEYDRAERAERAERDERAAQQGGDR